MMPLIIFVIHLKLRLGRASYLLSFAPLQFTGDFTKKMHSESRLENGEFIILPEMSVETRYHWFSFYFAPSLGWKIHKHRDNDMSLISIGPFAFSVSKIVNPV